MTKKTAAGAAAAPAPPSSAYSRAKRGRSVGAADGRRAGTTAADISSDEEGRDKKKSPTVAAPADSRAHARRRSGCTAAAEDGAPPSAQEAAGDDASAAAADDQAHDDAAADDRERELSLLTPVQRLVLGECCDKARVESGLAITSETLDLKLRRLMCPMWEFEQLILHASSLAPVTVHVRLRRLDSISRDGCLKNMFETKFSSGNSDVKLRDSWETLKFGTRMVELPPGPLRPKYGSVNLTGDLRGAARSYGDAYFLLRPGVRWRTTCTSRDSSHGAAVLGALWDAQTLAHVLADHPDDSLAAALRSLRRGGAGGAALADGSLYLEAQVHGPLRVDHDVEALVVLPEGCGDRDGLKAARRFCKKHPRVALVELDQ